MTAQLHFSMIGAPRLAPPATYRSRSPAEFRVFALREAPAYDAFPLADTPALAADYWRRAVAPTINPDLENLVVLLLTPRRRIKGHSLVAQGLADTVLVHPRELFRAAIVASVSAIILMHNHPGGDPQPSEADIHVTRKMIQAGQLIQIPLLDHLVIGRPSLTNPKDYTSLKELGYFF